ncbi:MAG: S8 family peptidase [Cyanomargarita calcarea GSE-NOS-MK-12-04C]|jgi:subtilisin family serine protease|uniref:S8 family peptidase n=1 Tax=Cyanomargarita calcarea GSE-NOS-MK-12-04C TaxID=2839659 RepID=A0A951UU15_9CYAN|nr:S8 family peptidase [Cyanomargarita calcarea GSE-NOS-MK-12-04C]
MRHEKLSPGLLLAFEDYQREGEEGLITQKRSLGIIAPLNTIKPARTVVFIYCDEQADLSHLEQYGIEINQDTGHVRTAYLPIDALDALSEDPEVQRIKPSRKMYQRMDIAPGKVKLPEFKNKTGLTGKGVVIGIVDSGIDPKHPAFAGRILRIWDQTLPGPGVKEGGYGAEFTGAQLTVSNDTVGHGTHVAGIASGADSNYGGVAPLSELVIVKTDMQDAHIADGIRYAFRVASELGRPAVVNLSLGGHADAHDGSDSLSKIIDSESGPGRIICCAAGNEGNDNIHGQAIVPRGKSAFMRFSVPLMQTSIVWLNGWYSGNNQMEISLRSPNGFVTPFQKIVVKGNPTQEYTLLDSRVQIVTPGPDPANGDHNFFVQIRGTGPMPVSGGVWQLRVRNTSSTEARLDVWTLDDQSSVFFTGKSAQDTMKIGSPGAATSAVTVASYTTMVKYTDIDNKDREVGLELDDISDFSSEGPLRNKAQKPDIAAPGAMIVSTQSSGAKFDRSVMVNSKFVVMAGTSMAAPFVTGLVALLLQRDPKLDPAKVKELLRKNSSIPKQPAGTYDNKWGYGLINIENM